MEYVKFLHPDSKDSALLKKLLQLKQAKLLVFM
jgi:hypothetical protein